MTAGSRSRRAADLQTALGTYGSRIDRVIRRHFWAIASVVLIILSFFEMALYGGSPAAWDPLVMSAVVVLILGMRLGLHVSERLPRTIDWLVLRGSLEGSGAELARLVYRRADRYSGVTGIIVAALLFVSYTAVYLGDGRLPRDMPLVLAASVGGYLGGRVIGRMVAVGQLGVVIDRDARWTLWPQVANLDGAAGLAPVGRLYFKLASVLFLPAVFLMGWWLIIPLVGRYEDWRPWYMGFFLVAVGLEVIAFVWPMWSFHTRMVAFRDAKLVEVDAEASHRQAEIERLLPATHDPVERANLRQEMGFLHERYDSVARCPTGPVERQVRRRFSVRNVVLLVPLLVKIADLDELWSDVAGALGEIFGD